MQCFFRLWSWGTLGGLLALVVSAPAADRDGATNRAPMQFKLVREQPAEQWQIRRGVITYRGQPFTFIVPENYRLDTDDGAGRIQMEWASGDADGGNSTIRLQFYPLSQYPTNAPNTEWLMARTKAAFKAVEVLGDFPALIAGHNGPGLEVRCTQDNQNVVAIRTAAVVVKDIVIEATHVTGVREFERHRPTFHQMLLSLRGTTSEGKLDPQPVSLE